jgi:acyl-CoA hydrolase
VLFQRLLRATKQVYPKHCNTLTPMIFGGFLFSFIDETAHTLALFALEDSECNEAVTYKIMESTFHAAAELGDILLLECEIVEVRNKSIRITVKVRRKKPTKPEVKHIADAELVFVSRKDGVFTPHGLEM